MPTSINKANAIKADLLLILVTILAAISWMFSKEALYEFPPLLFIGIRFLLAGILLSIPGYRTLSHLTRRGWITSSQVGVLFGIAMSFWILGLSTAQYLGEGSFITSISVVLVPLLTWLLFKDRFQLINAIAIPLALLGLAFLSLRNGFSLETSQIYFLISAVLLSFTFILNGRAAARIPALALSAIQLSWVGIIALSLSYCFELWPDKWTATMWLWLSLSIVIGTAARFYIQTIAQGLTSPSHAAVILIIEPIWTSIFAALWFDERMSIMQILGCSLIFAALLVNRWKAIRSLIRG